MLLMKQITWMLTLCVALAGIASAGGPDNPLTLGEAYPLLSKSPLANAKLVTLPKGVVLRSGDVEVQQSQLDAQVASMPEAVRRDMKSNAIFMVQQSTIDLLLLVDAKAALAKRKTDISKMNATQIVTLYAKQLASKTTVTDEEVQAFYKKNKKMLGNQSLATVKDRLRQFLLNQKRQQAIVQQVLTLSQRHAIEMSATWVAKHIPLMFKNPADQARLSGKPTLLDFGSKGCIPCDKLAPILKRMEKKYAGKANVVFIEVKQYPFLTKRYLIQSIPVQVFYDATGQEVFRHSGYWPQNALEQQLNNLLATSN
jgi:thioredoxin 1